MNPITTYAETDEDLLERYNKSSGSLVRQQISEEISDIEESIANIERKQELNEIYNQIVDSYNEEQVKTYKTIQNTVKVYAGQNDDISTQIHDNIETLSITELKNLDASYKANLFKMEEVVQYMNNVHISEDYRKTDYDLSDLYSSIATLNQEYEDAIDAEEIGDVKNIKWIMDEEYHVTSKYGYRVDPYSQAKITYHAGTDFRCPEGTEVKALFDGTVIDVGFSKSSGNYVTVQSSDRVKYYICHLKQALVNKGDKIKQYDVIALSGSTGSRCTGPHLHMALFLNGATYDVAQLFEE